MIRVIGHKNDGIVRGRKDEKRLSLPDLFKEIMPEMAERVYREKGRFDDDLLYYFKRIYTNILRDYEKSGFTGSYTFDKYAEDLPFYFNGIDDSFVPAKYILVRYRDDIAENGCNFTRASSLRELGEELTNWCIFCNSEIKENKEGFLLLRNGKLVDFEIKSISRYNKKLGNYKEYSVLNIRDKEVNKTLQKCFDEYYLIYTPNR